MSNPMGAGRYRVCPLCEARNKVAHSICAKCRTPLAGARVVALPAEPGYVRANPMTRMLVIGGLLAAIAAGLVVRGMLNSSFKDTVLAEEQVQASETTAAPVLPPAEVTGWTPGAVPAQPEPALPQDPLPQAVPPAWSSSTYPVAPVEAPSDPGTSMVGIAPGATSVREAARKGHVFTNDDLVETRAAEPAPEPAVVPPAPVGEQRAPRGETVARVESGSAPASRVAAAQRRVLEIRDRARATGQDLDDEMEDAIDAVREAQKAAIHARGN